MVGKRAKTSRQSRSGSPTAKGGKRPKAKVGARKSVAQRRQPVASANIAKIVVGALDEMKAVNVKVLDVRNLTDIADTMVIASGNSDRHVRSIADRVAEHAKKAGIRPMGVEGERDGEWVLVDLQDVIVHIMLPRVREFYGLENLWDVSAARREVAVGGE